MLLSLLVVELLTAVVSKGLASSPRVTATARHVGAVLLVVGIVGATSVIAGWWSGAEGVFGAVTLEIGAVVLWLSSRAKEKVPR